MRNNNKRTVLGDQRCDWTGLKGDKCPGTPGKTTPKKLLRAHTQHQSPPDMLHTVAGGHTVKLRPLSNLSVFNNWKRKCFFFFSFWPPVHDENAAFWKGSPEWNFWKLRFRGLKTCDFRWVQFSNVSTPESARFQVGFSSDKLWTEGQNGTSFAFSSKKRIRGDVQKRLKNDIPCADREIFWKRIFFLAFSNEKDMCGPDLKVARNAVSLICCNRPVL